MTALRALGGSTNCPGFGRLAIAQGHASTLNHAVAASVWSAVQTAENASLYIRDLGNEQAERFGRGLTYLFNDWIERFGPVKDCEVHIRQKTIKKMRSDARRRYERDMGAAYALEFLSYHIEAPYLPGEDAAFVYDLTADYISQAGDAARGMVREPRQESESGSSGFWRAASAFKEAIRTRRVGMRLALLAALAAWVGLAEPAVALEKVKFATNWLADPEAGGFFQAVADGTYAKYGLDVTVIPGGPQTNGALMLLFGRIDFFMGGDLIGDFMSAESKLPLVAVAADFQKSPQILMSHPGVGLDKWEDLPKANPIYLGAGSINTFYAWLRLVYGFKDEAVRPYNFNSAPFIHDKMAVQQGYVTSEPYEIEKQGGFKPNIFLLSDYGYSTYSTLIEARRDILEKKPDLVQRFVDASSIGWYHYLYGDNSKANAIIKAENPDINDDQIAYSIEQLKKYGVIDSGDTLTLGIGAMTDARWKDFFEKMVAIGMIDKRTDYKSAYTLQFVNKGVGLNLRPQ